MNIISKFFEGIDKSLDISLGEYGLLMSTEPDGENKYCFVYGTLQDSAGNYREFNVAYLSDSDIFSLTQTSWFEFDKIMNSLGLTQEEWFKNTSLVSKVFDIYSYHGHENIFGSNQNPLNEEEIETFVNIFKNN